MNIIKKAALGLAMLAGATALTAAPADARVTVGFGIGGYDGGYYDRACDPYSRWYDPYRCDAYGDYDYYNGPVFIDGIWLNGGYRSRWYGGHRQFYYNNGWHGGSGWSHGGFSHGGGNHWNGNGGSNGHWNGNGGGNGHWNGNGGGHWNGGGHGGGHHHH